MIDLVDFNGYEPGVAFYGGNAGRKIGITYDGSVWMVKYPEPTRGMRGRIASYTTSPLSEYLGSHIYALLGVPVHETILGHREGKLVCVCKDFVAETGCQLVDFHDLKNSMPDDASFGFERRPSDGQSVYLSDVLGTIYSYGLVARVSGVADRFWDMFVIDALIGNADRNNTNWGFLVKPDGKLTLAPVFDNGNSFFNKRRDSQNALRLEDETLLKQDVLVGMQTCYLKDDGHRVNPVKYIMSAADGHCSAAVVRLMTAYDERAVFDLIDSLPEEQLGIRIASAEVKEFYKRCLSERIRRVFEPTAEKVRRG